MEGIENALKILSERFKIIIFTCKATKIRPLVNNKTGVELIWEWLSKYNLHGYVHDITIEKPQAKYYIDDKAIKFVNWDSCLKEIT